MHPYEIAATLRERRDVVESGRTRQQQVLVAPPPLALRHPALSNTSRIKRLMIGGEVVIVGNTLDGLVAC
jgi:hypothetical protein